MHSKEFTLAADVFTFQCATPFRDDKVFAFRHACNDVFYLNTQLSALTYREGDIPFLETALQSLKIALISQSSEVA